MFQHTDDSKVTEPLLSPSTARAQVRLYSPLCDLQWSHLSGGWSSAGTRLDR